MKHLMLATTLIALTHVAFGDEIFKCERDGHISYQRTSCADARHDSIDRRYANIGRIGPDAATRAELSAIRQSRQALSEGFVEARDAALEARVEAQAHKQEQCRQARADVQQMYLERRYRPIDRDSETDLLRRAREACAP